MQRYLLVPVALLSGSVFASLPKEVTDSIAAVSTDITTVGGLLVSLAATVMGFRWLKAQFF